MPRKTSEELEIIKKKLNCHTLYSWSRYNCYKNDPYEYMLKYVRGIKEDRNDGIYGISGNICHTIIERMYSNEITHDQMLEQYENELLTFNLAELKYDRSDEEKNKKIADKYESCIKHFFKNHQPITKKLDLERFITVKVDSFHLQGYIDAVFVEDGFYKIVDWKSSSIYTGKKIEKERGQLLLYSEALRQLGIPLEKIKAYWNFLKYVTIESPQANGKTSIRNIERNEIGSKLSSSVKMWMKKGGYSEGDIEVYIDTLCLTNDIECLPDDIKCKYKMKDCYVEIPISEDAIDDLKQDIVKTLIEINTKEAQYNKTKDESIFWSKVTDENSYYFANLSGYSAKLHLPYKEYLESREMFLNKEKEENQEEDTDLNWLREL